jgi:hypothetical protein
MVYSLADMAIQRELSNYSSHGNKTFKNMAMQISEPCKNFSGLASKKLVLWMFSKISNLWVF